MQGPPCRLTSLSSDSADLTIDQFHFPLAVWIHKWCHMTYQQFVNVAMSQQCSMAYCIDDITDVTHTHDVLSVSHKLITVSGIFSEATSTVT